MTRGFLTIAYNSATGNYLDCAEALAYNFRLTQSGSSDLSVMVPIGYDVPDRYKLIFHNIVFFDPLLADPDSWNAHLKCQAYECSPYDETILVDADMLFGQDISWWWDMLSNKSMLISTRSHTYKGFLINEDTNPYRRGFKDNQLPNIYTALMYFKKCSLAKDVFDMAGLITQSWSAYSTDRMTGLIGNAATDDEVFACAVKELGYINETTTDMATWFSFVHLKMPLQQVVGAQNLDDRFTPILPAYVVQDGTVVVGSYIQSLPLHYHDRRFIYQPGVMETLRCAANAK